MADPKQKTIELALQGGGSHGAVTWGVLDRLLEDDGLYIEGISGTSAGAMNAVVVADGLAQDGPETARAKLHDFWRAISKAAQFSPLQRTFWDRWAGNWNLDGSPFYLMMDYLSRTFSPYDMNPLDLNPLREIVLEQIDFDRVNRCEAVKIFVTATNVHTGRPRVFRQPEISADSVMASAALPMMFRAVEIDGQSYWDGGYTGNPALFPLVDDCDARDLILVQVNPFYRAEVPQSARDIINRMNEITFNASLIAELRSILLLRQVIEAENLEKERYRKMRLHRIHLDQDLAHLSPSSKMNAEWDYLTMLRDLGRAQAERFLTKHRDDLGQRSSFDLSWVMEDHLRPPGQASVDQDKPKKAGGSGA